MAQLLDLVGETLGEVHDLDVFLAGDRATSLTGDERAELSRRRDAQARDAVRWGATIHAEPASGFAERLVTLWEVAAGQGPEPAR